MRILRAEIAGFGQLRDRVIDFGPGVTVLLGPNETGKTTLLYALAQTLLGKPSQRSAFPDMAPWGGGVFAVTLDLERDGARYRLRRRFDEKAGARAATLHALGDDGAETLMTQEQGAIRAWVAEALGTADDRIFYRTFCLTPADLTPLDNYAGLREQLERVTSGAEVAVAGALQRLEAYQATLRRGMAQPALPQNWGALKRADAACKDWEARLHEANRQQRRLHEVRAAVETLQRQLADGSARMTEISAVLEQDRKRRELLGRLAELKAAWANLEGERERRDRLVAEYDRLQGLLATLPLPFADPNAVRAQLHQVPPAGSGARGQGIGIMVAGLVLAALAWTLLPSVGRWIAPVIVLAGLGVGLPLILRDLRRGRVVCDLCAALHVATLEEAGQRLDAAEKYCRELDAMRIALQAVTDHADVTERRRAVTLEIATLEDKLAQMPGEALGAESAQRLQREYDTTQTMHPSWQAKEKELLRELAVLEDAERDAIDLEDGVAYWRREEALARQEDEALTLARELLVAAGEEAHRQLADPLAEKIIPLFAQMTGGRYPRVRVEGDARAFHIYPLTADGTPVDPEQLSRGTRDQFLLALRLAFGQAIAGEQGTPLFLLDDPLLHFDSTRRTDALAMLMQVGESSQIILATHDETLAEELPGATVVRLGARVVAGVGE